MLPFGIDASIIQHLLAEPGNIYLAPEKGILLFVFEENLYILPLPPNVELSEANVNKYIQSHFTV